MIHCSYFHAFVSLTALITESFVGEIYKLDHLQNLSGFYKSITHQFPVFVIFFNMVTVYILLGFTPFSGTFRILCVHSFIGHIY